GSRSLTLFLGQRDVRALVVDAVVFRVGARKIRPRVVLERVRAAEARGERSFRSSRNHDAEPALLAEESAVEIIGAIADRELRGTDVVENLRIGPRVRERAIRNQIAAP